VPRAQVAYHLVELTGTWLPPLALALMVAGVLVARGRRRATLAAALSVAVVTGVLLAGLAVGGAAAVTRAPASVPPDLVRAFYTTGTGPMVGTAQTILVLAVVLAAAAWAAGPSGAARSLRAAYTQGLARAGARVVASGSGTGPVGRWLGAQAGAARVAVTLAGTVLLVLLRPSALGLLGLCALGLVTVTVLDLVGAIGRAGVRRTVHDTTSAEVAG
jgi:hypothetical protein